jgi:hypothetical protein
MWKRTQPEPGGVHTGHSRRQQRRGDRQNVAGNRHFAPPLQRVDDSATRSIIPEIRTCRSL